MAASQKIYSYKGESFDSEQAMIMHLLDEYRCTEGFAARYLGAWKDISKEACVTGGLRTVCGREQLHADLLEARLRELGGTPTCQVPEERLGDLEYYGSEAHSDLEKLGKIANRVQDPDKVLAFLSGPIEQIEDDRDTRELLATILDDERSTIQWVLASWEDLKPQA